MNTVQAKHGERFYLIGDTAWELFHRLNREESELYLRTRRGQRFNFIQAVVLAELDGLTVPNPYGRLPLLTDENGLPDPASPDLDGGYNYFDHVESVLALYVGLLPTWGDKFNRLWGKGPEIFTPENVRIYGARLAERYRYHSNLVWVMGGDRPLQTHLHYEIIDAMAEGPQEHSDFLMTFHPCGSQSSSAFVHGKDWLDFNMIQSGHLYPCRPESYEMLLSDRGNFPHSRSARARVRHLS